MLGFVICIIKVEEKMSNYIELNLDSETKIFLETESGYVKRGNDDFFTPVASNNRIIEKTKDFLENSIKQIKTFTGNISNSIQNLDAAPDELEVEFSVKFTADAGIIISSVGSETGITIKLKWSKLRKVE